MLKHGFKDKEVMMANSSSRRKLVVAAFLCLALMLAALPAQAQSALTIDSFTDTQSIILASGSPAYGSTGYDSGNDILGGERDVAVVPSTASDVLLITFSGGAINHGQQPPNNTGYTLITWDGDDADPPSSDPLSYSGLGGVNLEDDPADRFNLEIVSCDHTGAYIVLTVYTDANNWSEFTLGPLPTVSYPRNFEIQFNQFQQGGTSGPANFASVGAITLMIDGRSSPDLDLTLDLVETYDGPTAVGLDAFTAAWDGNQVLVEWQTAWELNTVGFNVWRSTSLAGDYAQVSSELIPSASPGGMTGGSYAFTDSAVSPGTTYYYKLEELETGGARNWYGPTSTEGNNPNTVTLSAADTALAWWPAAAVAIAGGGLAAFTVLRRRRQR
jgi:hypothetical protein